jgi:acetate kinase
MQSRATLLFAGRIETVMPNALVLVINCGSSSVKFALYNSYEATNFKPVKLLSEGIAELLSKSEMSLTIKKREDKQQSRHSLPENTSGFHHLAIGMILDDLNNHFQLTDYLVGIGHRVVHGGQTFQQSVLIDEKVLNEIKKCVQLAPLHNPANITGIEVLQQRFPELPQVAVFDTAFHQTIPDFAYTYAIPRNWTEDFEIRRYGFHGTSHRFVAQQAAFFLEKQLPAASFITAHLGNGASVTAIKNGESVDTTMGLTPLEGLVMGTRSGDIDPGIFDFLINKGLSPQDISQTLNKKSGLLGISGLSHDMRTLCDAAANGHALAKLALEVFSYRAAKHIAAMMAGLDQIDALIFTGGIGENASLVRQLIVGHLGLVGFKLNSDQNLHAKAKDALAYPIHRADSHPILIIPTDEEAMIVSDTLQLIQNH